MTVDTFTNTFGMLTVYLGVVILTRPTPANPGEQPRRKLPALRDWFPYAVFGLALGMAAASKINAVSLALLLPAVLMRSHQPGRWWEPVGSFRAAFVDVVKVVTAFTLAHSITLSLAALGVVSLPFALGFLR